MALNNGVKPLNTLHADNISQLDRMTIISMSTIPVITHMQEYAKLITHLSPLSIGVPILNIFDLIVGLMNFSSSPLTIGVRIKTADQTQRMLSGLLIM